MLHEPTDEQLETLNQRFGYLCTSGTIERTPPLPLEVKENDSLNRYRVAFHFAKHGFGDLRQLIDVVNTFAPTGGATTLTTTTTKRET